MDTQQSSMGAQSSQVGKEAEGGGQSKQQMHGEGRGVVAPCAGLGERRRLQRGPAMARHRQDMVHAVFGTHRLASEARWPQLPGETCR